MTVVCFHNPSEENGYLSNWYPCRFTVEGGDFSSMEQYMMYKKAVYFGDKAVAAKILATDDVAEIKALGRLVANYSERYWNGIRQIVVFTGLLAKFTQNEGPGQAGYWQVEGAKPAGLCPDDGARTAVKAYTNTRKGAK